MGRILWVLVVVVCSVFGCGDSSSEAIRRGVGAECNANLVCSESRSGLPQRLQGRLLRQVRLPARYRLSAGLGVRDR